MTVEQYYSDESNYGNYQYIPISQVIDSIELEADADNDSLLKGIPRYLFVKYALDGIREMNKGGIGDELWRELEIDSSLQFILPVDFVDYLKVFVVGDDKKLYLLDYNSSMNIAQTYLQDDEFNILFDDEGFPLEADGENIYNEGFSNYSYAGDGCSTGRVNLDTSKISKHGDFMVDKKRGVIAFSSNLDGKNIVLKYLSDGLQQQNINGEQITIHKHLKATIEDYIYFRAIDRRRNVSSREKLKAYNRYRATKHKATILLADITYQKINKAMRSVFKPLKF